MRSRPPKYTQRPGAEILVLRRAGFPYGAVFAGWRADSSATQNSDSATDSWATTAPLSFSMRNNSPAPNAGGPQAGRFSPHGVETPPCGTRPPSPPLRTESIGEIDVLAMSVMGNSRLAECFVWNYCMRASDTAARCFALFEGRGGPKP